MRRSFVPDSIPTVAHAALGASRYRDDLLCTARCQSRRAHKVARVPVCKVGGISTRVGQSPTDVRGGIGASEQGVRDNDLSKAHGVHVAGGDAQALVASACEGQGSPSGARGWGSRRHVVLGSPRGWAHNRARPR